MSDEELVGIEKDLRAMPIADEDKAPFLNLLFWAVVGLNSDQIMAVYDQDKDKLKAEIVRLEAEVKRLQVVKV
jgi:hypothetical protein